MPYKKWSHLCHPKNQDGMGGFCDLHAFNLALLAKQSWKLITEPHTLLTCILGAKYFSSTNILHASTKPGISYAWRSLLVGLQLLQLGIRKRVGTSLSIHAWQDPWLPKSHSFKPLPYNHYLVENLRVADLISYGPRRWSI